MQYLLRSILCLMLLLAAGAPCAVAAAEQVPADVAVDTVRQELLAQQGYLAWQRINEARLNPRETLLRLGISRTQARKVLGEDAWVLDRGLPPLAWNQSLQLAAGAHSRDMFTRLYYSHVTPEGLGPVERVAAAGYQATRADETLAALVFASYVDIAMAVDFMIDTMLRDELTGTPGVRRNIFSPKMTELGVAFSAESIPLIENNPYIYLFALDFAQPLIPRGHLVGSYDPASGRRPAMLAFADGVWNYLPLVTPGFFQTPYPDGGALLILVGDTVESASAPVFVYDGGSAEENQFIDLSVLDE